jgi:hypothetical protein
MKPSYAVSKKTRKSSRFYNLHRHVRVPGRSYSSTSLKYLRQSRDYFGFNAFITMMSMLFAARRAKKKP